MTPKRLSMVETRKINKKNNKEQPISKYVNARIIHLVLQNIHMDGTHTCFEP